MEKERSYESVLKKYGISYLGNAIVSSKQTKSLKHGAYTYMIYLAPWNLSGRNVCPKGEHCHELCLNGSGQNRLEQVAKHTKYTKITLSRIKKTKMFFEHREDFMFLLIHEIKRWKERAKREGKGFAVRLNGTSDLSPVIFRVFQNDLFGLDSKCILDIFPDVQFYDYTKVPMRLGLAKTKANYDLTFSYDGFNWLECVNYLENEGRVAVVFEDKLPKRYMGYKVIDANEYDMRYQDPKGVICGLHFHRVGSQYENGKYLGLPSNCEFVVRKDDVNCEW